MTSMRDTICSYGEAREDALVGYLYGELPADERDAFDRHLALCAICRTEVGALADVRSELVQWNAPELPGQIVFRPAEAGPAKVVPIRSAWQRLSDIPVWMQTAAAILCIGVGAGLANLQISYNGSQGLMVRTGWSSPAPAGVAGEEPTAVAAVPAASRTGTVPASATPWRSDVDALAAELRREFAQPSQTATPVSASDEAIMRKVRTAVQESEQRQQRELALRLAEIAREVQVQRQTDLVKIERNLGLIQRNTGMEVLRTQQQLNSLAQRVSQQP